MHRLGGIRIDLVSCGNGMNSVENSCRRRATVGMCISIHGLFQMMRDVLFIEKYALEISQVVLVDLHIGHGRLEK